MRITVLGSGTSTGVPVPVCDCKVCTSSDERDKRLRTSILVEIQQRDLPNTSSNSSDLVATVLVDTTPDLRQQALREPIQRIDAVLITHTHADHIFGLDDLRSFNFKQKKTIPIYASQLSSDELERVFRYALFPDPAYQGGTPPKIQLNRITGEEQIEIAGFPVQPLPVKHGRTDVLGFRFGDFAYITDCSHIPETTRDKLAGVDTLILDGLRERPHKTHFNQEQAVAEIERIKPRASFLTHITHEMLHQDGNSRLKQMTTLDVQLAYDGLHIEL